MGRRTDLTACAQPAIKKKARSPSRGRNGPFLCRLRQEAVYTGGRAEDRYGRKLRVIEIEERSVGGTLIAEGRRAAELVWVSGDTDQSAGLG